MTENRMSDKSTNRGILTAIYSHKCDDHRRVNTSMIALIFGGCLPQKYNMMLLRYYDIVIAAAQEVKINRMSDT